MANNSNLSLLNQTIAAQNIHFTVYIWPIGVWFVIGGVAGLFGNVMIVFAITTSVELKKNRCNILVTNLAAADIISCIYFIICGVIALIASVLGPRYLSMSNEICFYTMIPVITSLDAAAITILAIGIDRAVSLLKPMYYKTLTSKYIFAAIAFSWTCGLINIVLGWLYIDLNETVPTCAPPTALRGAGFAFWAQGNVVINILVVVAYAIAFWRARRMTKFRTTSNDQALRSNRLLNSLVIFVCVYITSALLTNLVVAFVHLFGTTESIIFHGEMYVGILANISAGCNFYIYYARSEEYRRAFRKVLGLQVNSSESTNGSQPKPEQKQVKPAEAVNGVA